LGWLRRKWTTVSIGYKYVELSLGGLSIHDEMLRSIDGYAIWRRQLAGEQRKNLLWSWEEMP